MEYFEIMGYYVGVSSLKWWVYPASQSFWVMYQNEHDVFLHRQEAMEGLSLVTKRNFTDWKKKQLSKGSVCEETRSGSDKQILHALIGDIL